LRHGICAAAGIRGTGDSRHGGLAARGLAAFAARRTGARQACGGGPAGAERRARQRAAERQWHHSGAQIGPGRGPQGQFLCAYLIVRLRMQPVMRYTGLSARERDAATRGVPVPARLAGGAGRDFPHSPNAVSRPAPRQDHPDRRHRRHLPLRRTDRIVDPASRRADLRTHCRRLRPPFRCGIPIGGGMGRCPGHGMVRAPVPDACAARAAFPGGGRCARRIARPLVRTMPHGRLDVAVGAAGGLPREPAPCVPGHHRFRLCLADGLHRAGLAAG